MDDIKKEVGILLRDKRNVQGYSLDDVINILEKKYKIKMNQSTLTRYEKGEIGSLNPILLKGICKTIGLDYLEIFKKLNFIDSDIKEKSNVVRIPNDKVVELPVYGQASAGNGYINMDKTIRYLPFLKGNFSKDSFLVKVCGDSMTPTILEGSLALVDPEQSEYIKGKIYVVTYNEETFIKRVEKNEEVNIVVLKSDNPLYGDIYIPEEKQEFLEIEGRVIRVIKEEEF